MAPFVTERDGSSTYTGPDAVESGIGSPRHPTSSPVLPGPVTPNFQHERITREIDVPVIEDDIPPTIEESMIAGEVPMGHKAAPSAAPDSSPEASVVPSDEVAVDRSEHGVAFEFEAYPGAELAIATPSSDAGEPAA
ncbi:MAG: hypothetical protein JRH20_24790, partial [Deltaproteobacteria bacterium]|nr:hypothetical protein [Deltaproteobacteria bacterium]